MSLSDTKRNMLKRFGAFSRHEAFFLMDSIGWVAMKQATVTKYLRELESSGLIFKVRTGFKISEKGRAMVDGPGASTQPTRHVNASQPNMHKLPFQMIAARPGSDDHKNYRSHGTLC